jgi:hypothetical protein
MASAGAEQDSRTEVRRRLKSVTEEPTEVASAVAEQDSRTEVRGFTYGLLGPRIYLCLQAPVRHQHLVGTAVPLGKDPLT